MMEPSENKKIRVLIAMLGIDQHEVGAIAISRILRNAGMEVIYVGRFNLPPAVVNAAVQEDVDVIGLSCHSWEYQYFVPELIQLIADEQLEIPLVVGGSVVTPKDEAALLKMGVKAAFGPSSTPEDMIETIRDIAQGESKESR